MRRSRADQAAGQMRNPFVPSGWSFPLPRWMPGSPRSRFESDASRRRRNNGAPPCIFPSISKIRLVFAKLFQRKLWRFCGISTGCKPPDPTMTFLQIFRRSRLPSALFPPPSRRIRALPAAGAPERGRAIGLQRVVSRSWGWAIPNAVDLEFSLFLINRKKNVRGPGLIEPFAIQRPLWRRREFPPPMPVEPSRVKRRLAVEAPTNVSGGSTHSPDFAAHVHEIETAAR